MNPWLSAAIALLPALIPGGIVLVRGDDLDRLVALELAGALTVLILVLLAQGFARSSFYDLALTLALLSFPAGLAFARILERWL